MKRHHKIISLLISFILTLSIFTIIPVSVSALDQAIFVDEYGNYYGVSGECTWTLNENGVLTVSGSGPMGEYFGGVDGNNSPFSLVHHDHRKISKVIIEDGVTSIGQGCFLNIDDTFMSITIADTVTRIGDFAFYQCYNLKEVKLPNSDCEIGRCVFEYCHSIAEITIPEKFTMIGEEMFFYCNSLQGITIPDSVTSIGKKAFYDCGSLTSVTVPKTVTEIGDYAFGYCGNPIGHYSGFVSMSGYVGSEAERYYKDFGTHYTSGGLRIDFTFIPLNKTGDADGDDEVTSIDVTCVQRYCASINTGISEDVIKFADVDKNDELEIIDATYIQRWLAHIDIPYEIG